MTVKYIVKFVFSVMLVGNNSVMVYKRMPKLSVKFTVNYVIKHTVNDIIKYNVKYIMKCVVKDIIHFCKLCCKIHHIVL